jgi:hypothetical protein
MQNYYSKAFKNLEDSKEAEIKQQQRQHEQDIGNLENSYRSNQNKREQESERIINTLRDNVTADTTRSKKEYIENLDDLKDNYTKQIRMSRLDGSANKDLQTSINDAQAALEKDRALDHALYEEKFEDLKKAHLNDIIKRQDETTHVIKTLEDNKNHLINEQAEKYKSEIKDLREENTTNRAKLEAAIAPEIYTKTTQDLVAAQELQHKMDLNQLANREKSIANEFQKKINSMQGDYQGQHDQHILDLKEAQDRFKGLSAYQTIDNNRHRQELKDSAEREEKISKAEIRRLQESLEAAASSLKRSDEEKDKIRDDVIMNHLQTKDDPAAKLIAEYTQENYTKTKQLDDAYNRNLDDLNQRIKNQDRQHIDQLETLGRSKDEALKSAIDLKAQDYKNALDHQTQVSNAKINELQRTVEKKSNPNDLFELPPGVETKIRKGVIEQYEKNLANEAEKNKVNQDKLREHLESNFRENMDAQADKQMRFFNQTELDNTQQRIQFNESMNSWQEDALTKNRDQENLHEHELNKLTRKFTHALDRQQREYENIMENMKTRNESKIIELRLNEDNQLKSALKAISESRNQVTKEYERKLADERDEHEFAIEDLKTQYKAQVFDVERRSRQDIETQAKTFEQKIAQLDEKNKEHERYLEQNYNEQLDKMRRNYELSNQQKKS